MITSQWNKLESAKTASVDDQHVNAPCGSSMVEITPGTQKRWLIAHVIVISSPWNRPESAKTASVDHRHVNAPWGSSMVEITPGTQNGD